MMAAPLTIDVTDLPAAAGPSAIPDDGLDDSAAVQAAVDYAAAERAAGRADRVVIHIPAGVYDLADTVVIGDAVSLIGEGMGRSVLRGIAGRVVGTEGLPDSGTNADSANRDAYLFDISQSEGVFFKRMTLRGPDLHGAIIGVRNRDTVIHSVEFNGFAWSAVRTYVARNQQYSRNLFVDAGGRAGVTTGATGGAIYGTYLRDSEFAYNRFEKTEGFVGNYFGIKGRQFRDTRIHHNSIGTSFAIELPFENDSGVEIDHNRLEGVVSIPKFAGGLVLEDDLSFHIHHNLFTTGYAVELTRNSVLIEKNVFTSPIDEDRSNVLSSFGSNNAPGPLTFRENLVLNPGRGVFWSDPAYDNVTILNNEVIVAPTPTPRTEGLFGFFSGNANREGTDFSTVTIAANLIEVFGDARPLVRNAASATADIRDNELINVSDTSAYPNPDTGAVSGLSEPLLFRIGADNELVDGAAMAQAARDAAGALVGAAAPPVAAPPVAAPPVVAPPPPVAPASVVPPPTAPPSITRGPTAPPAAAMPTFPPLSVPAFSPLSVPHGRRPVFTRAPVDADLSPVALPDVAEGLPPAFWDDITTATLNAGETWATG